MAWDAAFDKRDLLTTDRVAEVERMLALFKFPSINKTPFSYEEIRSPLVIKHAVFEFTIMPTISAHDYSGFVAIFPLVSSEVRIVPLYKGMYAYSKLPELDRHNIATFNWMIAAERPELLNDTDRVRLAILYLSLFDRQPQIIGTEYEATRGRTTPLPTEVSGQIRPSVTSDSRGRFTVVVFVGDADSHFERFSLDFNKTAMLRNVRHQKRSRANLLRR